MWERDKGVWRIEFQVRDETLKLRDIQTPDDGSTTKATSSRPRARANDLARPVRSLKSLALAPAFGLEGIQPGPLERYVRGASSGERADGLLQRF